LRKKGKLFIYRKSGTSNIWTNSTLFF
jgi:hypothetical protein